MWLAFIFLNTEVLKLDRTVCVGRPRRMRKSSFSVRAQSSASKCTSNKFVIEFHHSLCWTLRSGQEVVAWEKTSKIRLSHSTHWIGVSKVFDAMSLHVNLKFWISLREFAWFHIRIGWELWKMALKRAKSGSELVRLLRWEVWFSYTAVRTTDFQSSLEGNAPVDSHVSIGWGVN